MESKTMTRRSLAALACTASFALSAGVSAEVVWQAIPDNGFFTPFNAGNASVVRYGNGGWLGGPDSPPVRLESITLELVVFASMTPGTTDIVFTFNDGDPSGLVFGSGKPLYSTTITGVKLPASPGQEATFQLEIPLPTVMTAGGFNNVGWSVGLRNFDYAGQFGFAASSCKGQITGFYTNNASFFDGSQWSLFAFGQDPCSEIANFAATIVARPECTADFDGNGAVDGGDLATMLGLWDVGFSKADLNGDGAVDGTDLAMLLAQWGPCS
jgi:hypothetical protein